ncbi:hypothetical protein COO60DRAFT_483593 [Scenedesmus sp. NREL 46B-D3]|nr:hypothetical protein COO60DRAFT_483593 [Scenedesmus sp. NREL 46B-D3]
MRLPSIISITMKGSTGMLAALPACSLKHLDLIKLHGPVDGPAVSAALARLTNLQWLHIGMGEAPYSSLAGVAQLTRLTLLEVSGYLSGSEQLQQLQAQPLQQLLAQPLPLRVLRLRISRHLPPLDLSHLTQLRELYDESASLTAVFPSQLQQLQLVAVGNERMLQAVLQLQQLRRLTLGKIGNFSCSLADVRLSCLDQLPALQQLELVYDSGQQAAAAAAIWPQLPQLCALDIMYGAANLSKRAVQPILNGAAACINLTYLWLDATWDWGVDGDDDGGEGAGGTCSTSFAKLAGLTNLKHLHTSDSSRLLVPGDALALVALTSLTTLALARAGAGVGDEAATALAGSCQQLCRLDLMGCSLFSMACLASVAHLTQLTWLGLAGNRGLTPQGLMLLTGLKRQRELYVDRDADVMDEVVERFWAAVRQQQEL